MCELLWSNGTDRWIFPCMMPGMTMEVLGTLVGAAIQGQIVASAHTLKHCPPHNMSAGYLGNSSGAEIIKSLVHSQDYLSHSVSFTMPSQEPRCAQGKPQSRSENNLDCQPRSYFNRSCGVCSRRFSFAKYPGSKKSSAEWKEGLFKIGSIFTDCLHVLTFKMASCFNPCNPWDWKETPLFDIWTRHPELPSHDHKRGSSLTSLSKLWSSHWGVCAVCKSLGLFISHPEHFKAAQIQYVGNISLSLQGGCSYSLKSERKERDRTHSHPHFSLQSCE